MNKYGFGELVSSGIDLSARDVMGVIASEWFDCGVLGYDSRMDTYFLQLDTGGDHPVWWFGDAPRRVLSPWGIALIISSLFQAETFEFDQDTLASLAKERDDLLIEQ